MFHVRIPGFFAKESAVGRLRLGPVTGRPGSH